MITVCAYCGSPIERPAYSRYLEASRHFCNRTCNLKMMNAELNPTRMTYSTRVKIRNARLGTGKGKSYPKLFGRHLHRVVAEIKIGRKLMPGEVVHHENENKRNPSPENLRVFASQSEHAAWHAKKKRGDAK
ncbi:HNH endonuclease [Paenibacillus thailandensis]|uniref:HNH endonuclease n=2 Tax=Paenibacillus thailandensis TaxID=393250 RepID=A0ABW5QSV0_9BACL